MFVFQLEKKGQRCQNWCPHVNISWYSSFSGCFDTHTSYDSVLPLEVWSLCDLLAWRFKSQLLSLCLFGGLCWLQVFQTPIHPFVVTENVVNGSILSLSKLCFHHKEEMHSPSKMLQTYLETLVALSMKPVSIMHYNTFWTYTAHLWCIMNTFIMHCMWLWFR